MEQILAILNSQIANGSPAVRRLVRNGRKVTVAPAVLIVPGVLNGSAGPLYYPAEQLSRKPRVWDGMPMVVYHPVHNGKPVSARKPEILEKSGVGFLFDTAFDDRLRTNLYFDDEDTNRVDARILPRVHKGEKIELSTGVFTTNIMTPGTFANTPYDGIATDYEPDHVAILPDQKGACGIEHGCGVLANSDQTFLSNLAAVIRQAFGINAQLSHSELRMQLNRLIEKRYKGMMSSMGKGGMVEMDAFPYVIDVYDKAVVFWSNGRTFRQAYRTDLRTNKVELEGEAQEVIRVSSYKTLNQDGSTTEIEPKETSTELKDNWADSVDGTPTTVPNPQPTESNMNREATVNWLVANCECWKDKKDELLKLSEASLNVLKAEAEATLKAVAIQNAAVKGFTDKNGTEHRFDPTTNAFVSKEKEAPVANAEKTQTPPVAKPVTTAEWLSQQPEEVRNAAQYMIDQERNEKAVLANQITEHITDQTARTAEAVWLMQKPLPELRRMKAFVPAKQAQQTQNAEEADEIPGVPSYIGANVGGVTNNQSEDLLEPVANIDWSDSIRKKERGRVHQTEPDDDDDVA